MDIMKISAVALAGAVALLLFKQYKPEWTVPLRLAVGIFIAGLCLVGIRVIITFGNGLADDQPITSDMWRLILKGLGIAFVTEISSGICRDSGEATLSVWVEMAGKIALLLLALPLIQNVMDAVKTLLGVGG